MSFYKTVTTDNDAIYIPPKTFVETTDKAIVDNFEISTDYEDPFLKKYNLKKKRSRSAPKKSTRSSSFSSFKAPVPKPPKKTKKKVKITWPSVIYHGWINKNQQVFQKTIILSVEEQQEKITIGESFKNVKLINVWEDSVRLSFKDSIKIYQIHK